MVSIANAISDLVLEFNGAMSGEHGDGLARSHFNAKLFGPALYDAFRQVKRAFDPKNLMNPGKIVDAPAMTESLKISPQYKTWEPRTTLDFAAQGGFARAVEMCSGMGECRKKLDGTMCPSYMGTLDEEHSTRGRANALQKRDRRKSAAGRIHRQAVVRRDGSLPRMQSLQGGVPVQRRHGEAQIRISRSLPSRQRLAAAQRIFGGIETLNRHRLDTGAGFELACQLRNKPLAHGSFCRN